MTRIWFLVATTFLTSCAAGHGLTGTPVNIEPELPPAPLEFQAKTVEQAPLLTNWLDQFDDPKLIDIVNEALAANPSLAASLSLIHI